MDVEKMYKSEKRSVSRRQRYGPGAKSYPIVSTKQFRRSACLNLNVI